MAKKRLTPKQYKDELIYRHIKLSRYVTGQANYAVSMVTELNGKIAGFCLKKEAVETKGQYAGCKTFIRLKCLEYREKLYGYLQKELKRFIIEQAKWVYANSPVKLEKAAIDRVFKDVFFSAFSDTDTIKSYVTRIFNQIFQIWNAQLTIAYRTGQTMKAMVALVLDKEYR
jgi:hypothetical protein